MTREEAFEILGLDGQANREMIEARYERLIKGYGRSNPEKMAEINTAYRALTAEERQVKISPRLQKKLFGRSLYQWKNFLHYAKRPAIVIILVIAIAVSIIYSVVNKTEPDFVVVAIGEFYNRESNIMEDPEDLYTVSDFINESMEVDEPLLDVLNIGNNEDPQMDVANMTKRILYAGGMSDSDVMLLDQANFRQMYSEGVLINLEDFYTELQSKYSEEELAFIKPAYGYIALSDEEVKANRESIANGNSSDETTASDHDEWISTEEYIVGFDISENQLFNGMSILAHEQILAINLHNKDREPAFEFIEALIQKQDEILARSPGLVAPRDNPTPAITEPVETTTQVE